ncbi:hypothetical protein HMPREF1582_01297 [Gardnerella vaginalis JCP8151A]|nr:hypothetical protein HMPREF1582_01297 [Gardnerella vaginalis JCP8151A]
MSVCFIKSSFPNHLFGFHKSCFTSNRTALAKLTGVPPLHGSHVAILIACDGFITLGLLTVWGIIITIRMSLQAILLKIASRITNMNRSLSL